MLIFVANIVFKKNMLPDKLVSIICLCYNHEKFVVEALQSIVNQSYKIIEIIIVDDFSTDGSVEIIKKWLLNYPEIHFIINDKNLGNTKSFNKALAVAKGDFIIDFATDDVLLPNCVSQQIACFENSNFKNLGAVYGNAKLILEDGSFSHYFFEVNNNLKVKSTRETGDIYANVLSGGNAICSVSAMFKKEVFTNLAGYDENLKYEDLDFWIRASRKYDFDFIDSILIKKRVLDNSLGSGFSIKTDYNARKINYSTFCILKKAFFLNKNRTENKALLKRVHLEIYNNYNLKDYNLLFLHLFLAIKIRLKFFLVKKVN